MPQPCNQISGDKHFHFSRRGNVVWGQDQMSLDVGIDPLGIGGVAGYMYLDFWALCRLSPCRSRALENFLPPTCFEAVYCKFTFCSQSSQNWFGHWFFTASRVKHKSALDCRKGGDKTPPLWCLLVTDIPLYSSPPLSDSSWNL